MMRALRHPADLVWRLLLLFAIAIAATVAACGGGGDTAAGSSNPPPGPGTPAASGTVTGVAASGAGIANTLVTLKDSTNKAVTATTSTSGAFSLDVSALAPPFLLQVSLPSGTKLLSVSADGNKTTTINITPLTDVVVRSWYGLKGQSADTAFSNPATLPPPVPAQVRALAQVLVNNLQLAILANGAPVGSPEDLISKPFAANGTGMDKLLDNTRVTVRSGGVDLVLNAGSAVQTTALGFSTATTAITATSTTVNGTVTTSSQSTEVVPVQDAQQTALDAIKATLASIAGTITSKGAALTAADLVPFFDVDLLDEGQNRAQVLAGIVGSFSQGQSIEIEAERVRVLDASAGRAEVEVKLTQTLGGATAVERDSFFLRKGADGKWRYFGDGRIGQVSVHAEGRSNQGLFSPAAGCSIGCENGPSVNIDVRTPLGTVSSASATSSFAVPAFQRGATEVSDSGDQLDVFFSNTGALAASALPAAGTPVNITLQKAAGGSVSYSLPLNAFTTELIRITSPAPSTTTVRTGTLTVAWTLPTTYAVQRIKLSVLAFTGSQQNTGFQCSSDEAIVAPSATSGTVTVPATCNGLPVAQVNLNLATEGPNGERSMVIHAMNRLP